MQTFTATENPAAFDLADNPGAMVPQDDFTIVTNAGEAPLLVQPWLSGRNYGFGPHWKFVRPGGSLTFVGLGVTGARLAMMCDGATTEVSVTRSASAPDEVA